MNQLLRFLFIGILLVNSSVLLFGKESFAELKREKPNSSQKYMLRDLDFITNFFNISYAPSQWKYDYFGWDLNLECLKAKKLVFRDFSLTTKEFQRIVKNFCLSAKDYHVIPQFFSTEWSILPFNIQSAEGRYFVSQIKQIKYSEESFLLEIGDELLFFDNLSIEHAVENFRVKEIGNNYLKTDQALAEFYMTNRMGCLGHEIPNGRIEITFCKAYSKEIQKIWVEWEHHAEGISNALTHYIPKALNLIDSISIKNDSYFKKLFMSSHYKNIKNTFSDTHEASDMLGARKSSLPLLGKVVWETEEWNEFHAYLFVMDDSTIGGYVRIPSYYVDGDEAAFQFSEIIEIFEEMSHVLVIDQMNNGGGSILYLYALLAMLTDYELELPMHRIMLNQENVYHAAIRMLSLELIKNDRNARKTMGDTLDGVIVNYQFAKELLKDHQFILNQWNSGKLFTDYCYIYGIEKIKPHPEVNYTKPILVLTNSLDFSAGDFFPAIMQDNQRALIMGTRTAGAGGYIEKISFPNLSGIEEIDLTASFAMRSNGFPIENLGVTPDIVYEISAVDLQNNYVDFKNRILTVLKQLNKITSSENLQDKAR